MSDTKDGGHLYWRCRSKTAGKQNCGSVNYPDTELKEIICSLMGWDSFEESAFIDTVESISIQENGAVDLHLKSGGVKHFETLKLRSNHHETTSTDAFIGKIRCGECGNLYHRYCGYGKYVYWYCAGKTKVRTECKNTDYADYNLRKVSAYIMGADDFDEDSFKERIDGMTVTESGLEYHFKDGRMKHWQKR